MTPQLAPLTWTLAALGCGGVAVAVLACIAGWVLRDVMDRGDGQGGIPPLPRTGQLRGGLPAVVCTRCARGDTRLPCACGADCYAVECLGGMR